MDQNLPATISKKERLARLRLARCENVGPITFLQLLERFGTAEEALAELPELARRGGRRRPLRLYSADKAEAELERLEALGAGLLVFGEAAYPEALAAIPDAPPTLSYKGNLALLRRPSIAVVGARN